MKITISRIKNSINFRLLHIIDHLYDQCICKQDLSKYVPSVFRDDEKGIGMTGSQSTPYIVLDRIFSYISLSPADSFIDIGCGKGRVLAYLLKEKCSSKIYGIEINEISGNVAKEWTKMYDNVDVEIGDAFTLNYNQYTVLFLGRPFLPQTFKEFIELIEFQLTHPITFIYWADQRTGPFLYQRKGWTLKHREKIVKIKGLRIARSPQWFSIWEYDNSCEE